MLVKNQIIDLIQHNRCTLLIINEPSVFNISLNVSDRYISASLVVSFVVFAVYCNVYLFITHLTCLNTNVPLSKHPATLFCWHFIGIKPQLCFWCWASIKNTQSIKTAAPLISPKYLIYFWPSWRRKYSLCVWGDDECMLFSSWCSV